MSAATQPYFSIIVPCFNAIATIERTITSLLHNSFEDFELLFVDDGSQDETLSVLENYQKIDHRIRIFSQTNSGPNVARNLAIKESRGTYLLFLDADDEIKSDALPEILNLLSDSEYDYLAFGIEFRTTPSRVISIRAASQIELLTGDEIFEQALVGRKLQSVCWNKVINRKFLLRNNINFIADRFHGRDLIFTRQLALAANTALIIPNIFVTSWTTTNSYSRNFSLKNIESAIVIAQDHKVLFGGQSMVRFSASVEHAIRRHLRYIVMLSAFRLDNFKEFKEAVQLIKKAFHEHFEINKVDGVRESFVTILMRAPILFYALARLSKRFVWEPY